MTKRETTIAFRVAVNVKRQREKREWSQDKLGEEAGVSQAHIGLIEAGLRDPSLDMIQKLARGLGVDPSVLVAEV